MKQPKPIVLSEADKARFWSKVARAGPDDCWEWTAGCNSDGYGNFTLGNGEKRCAHRVAYAICNGDTRLQILHHCNNPTCCNSAHLYAGTTEDNMRQCVTDGRAYRVRGEELHCAKLTASAVREVRRLYAEGWFQREIAELYGCSKMAISKVLRGKTWKHILD